VVGGGEEESRCAHCTSVSKNLEESMHTHRLSTLLLVLSVAEVLVAVPIFLVFALGKKMSLQISAKLFEECSVWGFGKVGKVLIT
jgi:hypothetical protein